MNPRILCLAIILMALSPVAFARCLYNPETGDTQECRSMNAIGECLNFGPSCGEAGDVTYNPQTNTMEICNTFSTTGACISFGASSSRPGICAFNAASNTYQICNSITSRGECINFGKPCR